jgi:protein-tyrosine-phosphatase
VSPDRRPTRHVLIVCHANTSRSIIAEAVLLRLLRDRGLEERCRVRSAGIAPYARDGSLPSLDARFVLEDVGLGLPPGAAATDLKRHPELLERADLVLAMTEAQRGMLATFPVPAGCPIVLLRELIGEAGDIEDPAMQDQDVFEHCRDEITRCLEGGLDGLLARLEVS